MAKTYGDRWVSGESLGAGGQGDVFYATDKTGQYQCTAALKRLKNPNRADRFVREVEAIRSVDHEHVIKLIDHSPLEGNVASAPMFIVMQVAAGGDLAKRVLAYKDSLDSTLIVVRQLASALDAAHKVGVIHRDVKPQNVLFRDEGHHALLTDFGICYMHANDRLTPADEAVGPRVFMAPEMEGGRVVEVRPAADVYSLGKLIYYMISGGGMLPREAIHEQQYANVFGQGGRYHLLKMLLGKMICLEERRLKSMSEVIAELDQIASWESRAQITPLRPNSLDTLRRLQQQDLETQRIVAANNESRKTEEQTMNVFEQSFKDWLTVELQQICDTLHSPGVFECEVVDATVLGRLSKIDLDGMVEAISGVAVYITRPQNTFHKIESLQFLLCRIRRLVFSMGNQVREQPPVDTELMFIPYYMRPSDRPQTNAWCGYLTTTSRRNMRPQPGHRGFEAASHIHTSFVGENYTLFRRFRVSQWPGIRQELSEDIGDAFETFSDYLSKGASSIGN